MKKSLQSEAVFSILLVISIIIYMLMGATIFHMLENDNEQRRRHYFRTFISNITHVYNLSSETLRELYDIHEEACMHGALMNSTPRWDFIGSFYFTGTVLTTVGASVFYFVPFCPVLVKLERQIFYDLS